MGLSDWLHSLTDSKYSGSNVEMSNNNNQTWVDALHQATDGKYNNSNFEMGGGYDGDGSWQPSYSYEPEETPVIGDNGQPIYYGSKDSRTFDNKIWNGDFDNVVDESADSEQTAGSMEDDPDKVLRDTYNSWYRWKNGLKGDDQDHFYDTYGAFLGYDDGKGGYHGTAQDWYDMFNQSWLEGDDRRERWDGGNADFSVRNDYTEAYDNLYTVADENGNHYIPLDVVQSWFDKNAAENKVTDQDLANLNMFDKSNFIGSNLGTGQSVMDSISNIVTRAMLESGINPLSGSKELQSLFQDWQKAEGSDKDALFQRINNANKALALKDSKSKLNMSDAAKASYLNNLINNIYGNDAQQFEVANDRTGKAAENKDSLAYVLMNKEAPSGYHIKNKGEAPAPTLGQAFGTFLGNLKDGNVGIAKGDDDSWVGENGYIYNGGMR